MSSKAKKKSKRVDASQLLQQAQRLFQKGDFKQALKDAKVCFRQQPTEAARQLLQRVLLARADELCRNGLHEQCRALVGELQSLGATDESVRRALPELLLRAGLADKAQATTGQEIPPEARSQILVSMADHAVADPRKVPASMSDIRQGATQIRAALQALEAGTESAVAEHLAGIARSSPFADWKLFVRGLAAYYRQDAAEMSANWDRLDAQRPAARIAAPLRTLAHTDSSDAQNDHFYAAIRSIDAALNGGHVLAGLRELRGRVVDQDWDQIFATLRRSRAGLKRFSPELYERVKSILVSQAVLADDHNLVEDVTRNLEPPAIDPRWNRTWAMWWEFGGGEVLEEAEEFWQRYVKDLDQVAELTDQERTLAKALVWHHLGDLYSGFGWDERRARETAGQRRDFETNDGWRDFRHAIACYQESLRLVPHLLPALESSARAQARCFGPNGALPAYNDLLEHYPEHLDSLLFLARHFSNLDRPFQAREYVVRARKLKPLDPTVTNLAWSVHVAAARHYARDMEWDNGRQELDAAERLNANQDSRLYVLARRAVFELRAGQDAAAQEFETQSRTVLSEPTTALLVMAIESARYGLSRRTIDRFEREWRAALKKRCSTQTAGEMCRVLGSYFLYKIDFPGRIQYFDEVLAYVCRARRVKFTQTDLRYVCEFLEAYGEDEAALARYLKLGRKRFPECAFFHYVSGHKELDKGPHACNRKFAHTCYKMAVQAAEASGDPADAEILKNARAGLSFLQSVGLRRPPRFVNPFTGAFGQQSPFSGSDEPGPRSFGPDEIEVLERAIETVAKEMGIDPDEAKRRLHVRLGED